MKTLCLQQASKPDSGLDEALPGLEFALDERVFLFGTLPLARGNATSPIAQTKPIPVESLSLLSFGLRIRGWVNPSPLGTKESMA